MDVHTAQWRHLANMIERLCSEVTGGGAAACCQIIFGSHHVTVCLWLYQFSDTRRPAGTDTE